LLSNSKNPVRSGGPKGASEITEKLRETKEVTKGETRSKGPRIDHGTSGELEVEISTPKGIEITKGGRPLVKGKEESSWGRTKVPTERE
jgi:hypothetical protein